MTAEGMDSLRAAERLLKSQRLRAIAIVAWPWALSLATLVGGWLVRGVQLANQLDANTAAVKALTVTVATLATTVEGNRISQQQDLHAIGSWTAYATAGFQAYEPAKLAAQKRAYAKDYADSFKKIAPRKGGAVALADLFDNVSLP
jgi:hypothetical protein